MATKKPRRFRVTEKTSRLFFWAWFATLLVLFCVVCVQGVGLYHYSADELMHVDVAKGGSIAEVLHFSRFEPHPPVGFLLRHYWLMISDAPDFVRAQSLLFGIGTILLYYRMGRRLAGQLAGMVAATLVAFSHDVIVQSFLVRNYAIFSFFLALTFYYYLRWRADQRRTSLLAAYAVAAMLACLTHLSGLFALAALGLYEAGLWLQRKGKWRELLHWSLAHLPALGASAFSWWWLNPEGIRPFAQAATGGNHQGLWQAALYYPQTALSTLLPFWYSSATAYPLLALALLMLFTAARKDKPLGKFLILSAIAFALGMLLFGSNLYPFVQTRYALWLLPFVVLPLSWAATDLCQRTAQKYKLKPHTLPLLATLLLVLGWASYNTRLRFLDAADYPITEYQITEQDWQDLTHYLSGLDHKSLVIMRRADAILIDPPGDNPYRYMGKDNFAGTLMPYYHTQIFFDPVRSDEWHYHPKLDLRLVDEALMRSMLDGVDRLVFVHSNWTMTLSKAMADLIVCHRFEKELFTFPDTPGALLVRDELMDTSANVIVVDKQYFLDHVLGNDPDVASCFITPTL